MFFESKFNPPTFLIVWKAKSLALTFMFLGPYCEELADTAEPQTNTNFRFVDGPSDLSKLPTEQSGVLQMPGKNLFLSNASKIIKHIYLFHI